jgi:hypothetical protein
MAVTLSDCFSTRDTNKIIIDCCCQMTCYLNNETEGTIRIIDLAYSAGDLPITGVFIDGNPISYPIDIGSNGSVEFIFTICAPSTAQLGDFAIDIEVQGFGTDSYNFPLEAVLPSDVITPSSLDFGNVAIGSSASLEINVADLLLCCNDFYVSAMQAPFSDTGGVAICPSYGDQTITVFFTPDSLGLFQDSCKITINECSAIAIPVSGFGIEAPAGSSNGQKNKVDQTSTVAPCSPRTINNQCNTGQTARAAIASRAQTITRPAGGAGRGKGFSK